MLFSHKYQRSRVLVSRVKVRASTEYMETVGGLAIVKIVSIQ